MATWQRFEEMDIWQMGCKLVCAAYEMTRTGEFAKDFALRDQIRRAAISVPSNIAEGYERDSDKAFAQMLTIAKGSCGELRTQLHIAARLGYVDSKVMQGLIDDAERISKKLATLIKHLKSS